MAQISKPAIKPRVYKQFAVVTIVMTATMAMLAQGEYESTAQSQPAVRATPTPTSTASGRRVPRYGQSNMRVGRAMEVGDNFDTVDAPPPPSVRAGGAPKGAAFISSSELPRAGSENAGFTRQYLESLGEEELAELLRQLQLAGVADAATRERAMMVLETASRRRSGRATTFD